MNLNDIDVLELACNARAYLEKKLGRHLSHVRAPLVQTWRVQA